MFRSVSVALLTLVVGLAAAQETPIPRPSVKPGDSWGYRRTDFNTGQHSGRIQLEVTFANDRVIQLVQRSPSKSEDIDVTMSAEWNQINSGNSGVFNPHSGILKFPLRAGDSWTSTYDVKFPREGDYEVKIDSTLAAGHLTYGEVVLPGETSDEILVSCHTCHPSLCNDNLSGVAVATFLARHLQGGRRRFTYRFLFIPGTIGSITWLARNESVVPRIKHGLVLASVGDAGHLHYKRSRRANTQIDRAVAHVLRATGQPFDLMDFTPYGYDERQYCSPGYNLAVGCLSRTPYARYPEYHTSADNLDFVRPEALADSYQTCLAVFAVLEGNGTYVNQNPKGEPQLGRRGLYEAIGGQSEERVNELALLWVLNLSDGTHDLLAIAEQSGLPFGSIRRAADLLLERDLLR